MIEEEKIKNEKNEKIKKLFDPKFPLLKEFREKCPVSFKHSQNVALMIEAVAIELNLDIDLMKLVAFYHDIGKMFNTCYFTENQEDENLHDKLDPRVSYEYITRHVSDSVSILINFPEFPRKAIEIISRHHGNSVLRYFYQKHGKDKNLFRYKTQKPLTVEDAVLMIADQIEASTRSFSQSGKLTSTEDAIEKIFQNILDDGLLDDVYIRLGDFKKIKHVLNQELKGIYQKRVDYDELIKEDNENE